MSHRIWVVLALLILALAAVGTSCSGKKTTNPISEVEPGDTALNWVGTYVIYHEVPGKRDLSMLLIAPNWCGWGKKLKNQTLTDTSVSRILDESFNVVFLNPEADSTVVYGDSVVSCSQLARVYGTGGYPHMEFFKRNGEVMGPAPGYRDVPSMITLLQLVIELGSKQPDVAMLPKRAGSAGVSPSLGD